MGLMATVTLGSPYSSGMTGCRHHKTHSRSLSAVTKSSITLYSVTRQFQFRQNRMELDNLLGARKHSRLYQNGIYFVTFFRPFVRFPMNFCDKVHLLLLLLTLSVTSR